MAGTNNLEVAPAADIARGLAEIVDEVRTRLPDAVVLLNAILPRGNADDPSRAKIADVNARIARLADGDRVRWVDAGPSFLEPDGALKPLLMPDGLHPATPGYEVWATALRPAIAEALSNERRSSRSSGRSSRWPRTSRRSPSVTAEHDRHACGRPVHVHQMEREPRAPSTGTCHR